MLTHVASNLKRRHRKSKLALAHVEIAVPCGLRSGTISEVATAVVRVRERLAYACEQLFDLHCSTVSLAFEPGTSVRTNQWYRRFQG